MGDGHFSSSNMGGNFIPIFSVCNQNQNQKSVYCIDQQNKKSTNII